MRPILDLSTPGRCGSCRRWRSRRRGLCLACRHPETCRQLVEAGVPPMSARQLAGLMKKGRVEGRTAREIELVLAFVHPVLMQNISVSESGTVLKVKSAKYAWARGNGWFPEKRGAEDQRPPKA